MKRFRFITRFFTFLIISTFIFSFKGFAIDKIKSRNCIKCLSISPVAGSHAVKVNIDFKHTTTVTVNLLSEGKIVIKSFTATINKRNKSIQLEGILDLPEGTYLIQVKDNYKGKTYEQKFYKF